MSRTDESVPVRFGSLDPTPLRDSRRTFFSNLRSFAAGFHIHRHFQAVTIALAGRVVAGDASRVSCNSHRLQCGLRRNGAHT